jgi:succinoglycan biosynthesis protein ExoM
MANHISVCVCTLRRNLMLERLLRKLAEQESGGLFDMSIVVVDNDASGTARETAERLRGELSLDLTYGIEPVQMIAAARNHALRLAKGDHIAIIDDDEFPPPHWLLTMFRSIRTFDVDGALGPVIPFFELEPPSWLVKSRLCERPVLRTGTLLSWDQTRTGNVLVKKRVFDEHGLQFDLKYKTSGSDKEFFREAMQMGYRFVAVEEAPVYEVVPLERQTKGYYLRRARMQASNERKFRAPMLRGSSRILAPLRAFAALAVYTVLLPFGVLIGSHISIRFAEKWAYHSSWLLSMMGFDLAKKRT